MPSAYVYKILAKIAFFLAKIEFFPSKKSVGFTTAFKLRSDQIKPIFANSLLRGIGVSSYTHIFSSRFSFMMLTLEEKRKVVQYLRHNAGLVPFKLSDGKDAYSSTRHLISNANSSERRKQSSSE